MWKRLRQLTGGAWLALGAVLLLNEIAGLVDRESSFPFAYVLLWWAYLVLSVLGGAMLLCRASLGKWVITVLAGLLALYMVVIWSKAVGAPFWFQFWCGSLLAFAAWSIFVVQRRNA